MLTPEHKRRAREVDPSHEFFSHKGFERKNGVGSKTSWKISRAEKAGLKTASVLIKKARLRYKNNNTGMDFLRGLISPLAKEFVTRKMLRQEQEWKEGKK